MLYGATFEIAKRVSNRGFPNKANTCISSHQAPGKAPDAHGRGIPSPGPTAAGNMPVWLSLSAPWFPTRDLGQRTLTPWTAMRTRVTVIPMSMGDRFPGSQMMSSSPRYSIPSGTWSWFCMFLTCDLTLLLLSPYY